MKEYKTKQRSEVEKCLVENKNRHLTAEDIVEILKQNGSDVGRTTVYRTLERLIKENKVRRYETGKGNSACFQYVGDANHCHEHFHLQCTGCGQLFHVECEHLSTIQTHIESEHGFNIDKTRTVLYGICKNCGVKQ